MLAKDALRWRFDGRGCWIGAALRLMVEGEEMEVWRLASWSGSTDGVLLALDSLCLVCCVGCATDWGGDEDGEVSVCVFELPMLYLEMGYWSSV